MSNLRTDSHTTCPVLHTTIRDLETSSSPMRRSPLEHLLPTIFCRPNSFKHRRVTIESLNDYAICPSPPYDYGEIWRHPNTSTRPSALIVPMDSHHRQRLLHHDRRHSHSDTRASQQFKLSPRGTTPIDVRFPRKLSKSANRSPHDSPRSPYHDMRSGDTEPVNSVFVSKSSCHTLAQPTTFR